MPSTPADRNLLFGILAVQMDFVSRDDLIKAMGVWVLDKSLSIENILVERGALKPEYRQLLEPLVQAHIRQHDGDAQKGLGALSSVESLQRDLKNVSDPEIDASLLRLAKADPEATRSITGAPGTHFEGSGGDSEESKSNASGGRFRIIRPHARGGLGEVFLAKDEELGREVALKEIQKEHAKNSESRDRFVREAEITGGLEHPGIVPVYGLGHYKDGRPYYAMRFIRGASLKEAIEEFHATTFKSDRDRNLKLRELLGRFIDVCNAIEYAHSRGVLHRDLKPGNIMLGKYGETLVVDWGLAKVAGRTAEHEECAESTLSIASTRGSSETLPGSAIGTPAYMSPEQADGRLDMLGPATDVYSLGATLYMLLVGKPPFEGNAPEVLENVKRGQFTPPHLVDRRVAKPLSAICAKAMSRVPDVRYSSCVALAADVEAWMADERVTAHRESTATRIGRFARKHRTLAASLIALLATVSVLLTGSTIWIASEQSKTLAAKNEAERANEALGRVLYAAQIANAQASLGSNDALGILNALKACDESHRGWEHDYLYTQITKGQTIIPNVNGPTAASPDGRYAATISERSDSRTLRLHYLETGQVTRPIELPLGLGTTPFHLAISSDGSWLILGLSNGRLLLLDTVGPMIRKEIEAHVKPIGRVPQDESAEVTSIAVGPDNLIATSGIDGRICAWRLPDFHQIWSYRLPQVDPTRRIDNYATILAIAPDGGTLASFDTCGHIRLLDAISGSELHALRMASGNNYHVVLRYSHHGLLCIRSDKVDVFDTTTLKPVQQLTLPRAAMCADLSHDGTQLAYSPYDATIRVLPFPTLEHESLLIGQPGQVASIHYLGNQGKIITTGGRDARIWDIPKAIEPPGVRFESEPIDRIRFAAVGTELVCYGANVKAFDVRAEHQLRNRCDLTGYAQNHSRPPAISPDGKLVAHYRYQFPMTPNEIVVWDSTIGKRLLVTPKVKFGVTSVAIDASNRYLAACSGDGEVMIWDIHSEHLHMQVKDKDPPTVELIRDQADGYIRTFNARGDRERVCQFGPDGCTLFTVSSGNVRIFEVTSRTFRDCLLDHDYADMCFDSSGAVAAARVSKVVDLLDTKTWKPIAPRLTHDSYITAMAFHPTGDRLVTGDDVGILKVWDARTGQQVLAFRAYDNGVKDLSFSADGRWLASLGDFKVIRVWEATKSCDKVNGRGGKSKPEVPF